jgi:hypothetical protein
MDGHRHVTQQCAIHGYRLGGCKCMTTLAESHRYEQVACGPPCPSYGRPATWDDIYMGERDVDE